MANSFLQFYRQSVDDERADYLVMRDVLGPLAQENPELLQTYPDFAEEWSSIREANNPGTFRGLFNTAKSAFDRTVQAKNVVVDGLGEVDAADIAQRERAIQDRPSSVPWQDWTNPNITGLDAAKVFARDPIEILSNIVVSGFAGSLPALGAGLAGGAAGAKSGAAVGGFLGGPPGALALGTVGGTVGAVGGTFAGSGATEYGSKFLEVFRESGVDLTDPQAIIAAASDPELVATARQLALARGLPVAAFDAISAGLAGKFLKGLKGATTAQVARRGGAEALTQGALGGTGEVAGAYAAGEQIKPGAVFEEIAAEAVMGGVEVGGAAMRRSIANRGGVPPVVPPSAGTIPPTVSPLAPSGAPSVPAAPFAAPSPLAPTTRTNDQILAAIDAMTEEQQIARLVELRALATRTADEENEFQILAATVSAPPVAPPVAPLPPAAVGTPVGDPVRASTVLPMPAAAAPLLDESYAQAPDGKPVEFSYDGTAADAAEVFRNKVIPLLNEKPDASRRESILNATDADGRAKYLIKYGAAKGQVQVQAHPRAPTEAVPVVAPIAAPVGPLVSPTPTQVRAVSKLADKKALKVQKEFLADAVKNATAEAPETTEPVMAPEGVNAREEMQAIRKGYEEATSRKPDRYDNSEESKAKREEYSRLESAHETVAKEKLAPLVEKYTDLRDTPESKDRMMDGSDKVIPAASWRDLPLHVIEHAIDQGITSAHAEHLTIEVPGDGTFRVPNSKAALKAFSETVADFGKGLGPHPVASTMPTKAPAIPALKKNPSADAIGEAVGLSQSSDETRPVLHRVVKDGPYTIATDGRRLTVAIGGEGESLNKKMEVLAKDGTPLKVGATDKQGKTTYETVRFPNWRQVVPKGAITLTPKGFKVEALAGGLINTEIDTGESLRLVRLAKLATSEKANNVAIFDVGDGKIGFASQSPDFGDYASEGVDTVRDGGRTAATAANPDFLIDALTQARQMGAEKVRIIVKDEVSPIVITDGKKFFTVTMPVRLSAVIGSRSAGSNLSNEYATAPSRLEFVPAPQETVSAADRDAVAAFERSTNRTRASRGEAPVTISPRHLKLASTAPNQRQAGSLASAISRLFGRSVIFFEASSPIDTGGGVLTDHPKAIFVNVAGTDPIASLIGHELFHSLERTHDDLGKRLTVWVHEAFRLPDWFIDRMRAQGYAQNEWASEWAAAVIGDRFLEPEFWNALAQEAERRGETSVFRRVIDEMLNWLRDLGQKILNVFPGPNAQDFAARVEVLRRQLADTLITLSQRERAAGGDPAAPEFRTEEEEVFVRAAQRLPVEASRAQEVISVVERLRSQGGRFDLFVREFFDQGVREYIDQAIAALTAQLPTATESRRTAIAKQIATLNERAAVISQAQGVTFSPYHMAIALDDIQNADTGNLVTVLHEATEAFTLRLSPEMRGAVQNAVAATLSELRQQAAESAMQNRVRLSRETSATDLLAEAIGQKLAAEGIPDAPSLAQAIVRWAKDLYYRIAMAAQRAFGVEPSPRLALDWFENQMRRIVSGDYDYRLARMLDPYLPVSNQESVRHFTTFSGAGATPGGVADYFNPYTQRIQQPSVLTTSSDAFIWNLQFRETDEEIENMESRARQLSAAQNRVVEKATPIYEAARSSPDMTWEQWWGLLGVGEDPKTILATSEARVPGSSSATIGGERMSRYMDTAAEYEARVLLENIRAKGFLTRAKLGEAITTESDNVVEAAREVNRVEDDRRNAEVHEKAMGDKLRKMVRRFIADYSKGLSTAEQHGALAQAVRDADELLESDPIPAEYQQVFQSILDGKTPIWDYIREIARLELPLRELTWPQVRREIRDNADKNPELKALAKNKPLLVALSTLAVNNAAHFDDIALGRLADQRKYAEIHAELETIRRATPAQLQELIKQAAARGKATTLRERLRDAYIERRRDLRTARNRVAAATERESVVSKSLVLLNAVVEEAQIQGSEAPSEWRVAEGAQWTSMVLGADGSWSSRRRTLRFRPDGASVDSAGDERALAENKVWLDSHLNKKGGQQWQRVYRETTELTMIDLQRKNNALQAWKFTKALATIGENAKRIGGAAALRVGQKLIKFEGIRFGHSQRVNSLAQNWMHAWLAVQRSTGIKDFGILQSQVFDPVNYFLETNPGYDEAAAIRQAVKHARARLPVEPDDNFTATFTTLLRETKTITEYLLNVGETNGSFVHDPRLKSEFRKAIARGWLTNMRQMDGGLVRRIITDMEKAGWKLGFKELTEEERKAGKKPEVAGATTFDDLTTEETSTANTEALRTALKRLFTQGIVNDWLLPFVNKGGTEVFSFNDEPIAQLDLQDAWTRGGGDVLQWIDELAKKVGLDAPDEANPDPLAYFRYSMLKQIDGLFGMESKQAYYWSQGRNLFDPMGPKPHVMMDARLNDTIPSEHLDYAVYDEHTAQMFLAEIAFHASFGRNGEALVQDLAEMSDASRTGTIDYQGLQGTTKAARTAEARGRGLNYADLAADAQRSGDVENLKKVIEYTFGVGRPGGPFDEARVGMAALNFAVGQTIDTIKVGLYNWVSNFQRPMMMRSLGPSSIKSSFGATGTALHGSLGSILDAVGLHLLRGSEYYKQGGVILGNSRNQPWSTTLSYLGAGGRQGGWEWLIKPLKLARNIQNKGARPLPMGDARDFPRFAPIPGMGVNNYVSQLGSLGGITQSAQDLEKNILKGIQYFATHREDASDPTFRFKAADLGYTRFDQGVFEFWRDITVDYGLGRLEDIVRDAMPRQVRGERLVTEEQLVKVAQMTMTVFDGLSSINTTPTFIQSNSVLRWLLPLLRWPFWQMNQVNRSLTTAAGRFEAASVARGLATMALWTLPVGLAFTFAFDRYDEDVLKKKSPLPGLGKVSAIPLVGPIVELMTSDRSMPDTLKAFLVRGSRSGAYGIAGDLAAQIAAPGDAASGRRIFSMDQRIFVMSQLLNVQQAFSNAVNQDWTTTWASVWSPVVRAIGGNGFLHALDTVNGLAGLDNVQSRLVMRTNASGWLRAAAHETDVPVRRAGGSGTPTPMSVWTREMLTSAMANDQIGFREAHGNALAAARKAIASDPHVEFGDREREAERRVLAGWRARDPLSVLAHPPTDAQMARLYSAMSDQGRADVREALARYANFSRLIQPVPTQGRRPQAPQPPRRPSAYRLASPSPFAVGF